MEKVLCLDIGGSSIKSGLVDISGNITDENKSVIKEETYESFLETVKNIVDNLSEKPKGIAAAFN